MSTLGEGKDKPVDLRSEADKIMESFIPEQVTLKGKYKLTKKTKMLLRHGDDLMIVIQPISLYRNGVSLDITVMKGTYPYGKQLTTVQNHPTGPGADPTEASGDTPGPRGIPSADIRPGESKPDSPSKAG